ncbi:MAG: succinate-semialdehyde dehydrogenase (NADP(+)) [Chromatiales bacterium]|jgi:succinate-semialdehyde dehydrogenase/glutarate-semialdehyde dehydrogenase|nr:succinate-semialdehyde dehydrogenase (NADP(+)) [Chromatiales bacterium]MDP7271338.1 NAD-dependent succinate-semialdehyde dehydrogenase [Gammaproteobacteria bacterium]HJP04367.1 NAD-dependent succinate-semialdehyde dehydrogenase [Gammaproteobacteria bacterium]
MTKVAAKTAPRIVGDERLLCRKAFSNGQWIDANDGTTLSVLNPADGSVVAEVPNLGVEETRKTIAAAYAAQPGWATLTAKERATILRRWHDLMLENKEDLARLMTAEQGKPLAESRGEVIYGASFVEWFAEEGKRIYGDVIPTHAAGKRILVVKQPIGVVAAITPWNFPIAMITRKAGPALAAGCTFIVKPAGETPLCALALAELATQAGIPAGVFNVLTTKDSRTMGVELTGNPLVRKFSFTGSTEVGKVLMRQCADTVTKTSMELGGNAPFIVFDDADLDEAVLGAMASKYRNAGQTCVCANRFLVQDSVYDAFAEKFTAAVATCKVGSGFEEGITIGPLINTAAVDKVEELVNDAVEHGARAIIGGERDTASENFYMPTVLVDVTRKMKIHDEEIFGPVATLFRFETEAEAVALANDTPYGLAAYFYARDIGRIWRVQEGLDYGIIGVNEGIISTEVAPFGGIKESGIGREGSKYGIEDFIEVKYILQGGLTT